MSDPWRKGTDPIQRLLRATTVVVCLVVFVYLSAFSEAHADDLPSIFLAVGCLMVLLGYEGIIRLPWVGRSEDRQDDDDES